MRTVARPAAALAASVALLGMVLAAGVIPPAGASLVSHPKPVVLSFVLRPGRITGTGGVIRLIVRVRNARTCTFGGAGVVTKACGRGGAVVVDNVPANTSAVARSGLLWVFARGAGGRSPRRALRFFEGAAPTACTGSCRFTFPAVDDAGVASVTMNGVAQAVAWPDPNPYSNYLPVGDQLDDVSVTLCAGPNGITDASMETGSFSLSLPGGLQGALDAITYDNAVPTALANYGPVAPGQCVTGDLFFDVPGGSPWTAVNFNYDSYGSQLVYVWHA